jgi:carboxymethylenebutenolidase
MPPLQPALTRPDGPRPQDFHLSRRGIASLLFAGYAVSAHAADAEPVHTDEQGLAIETVMINPELPAYVARPAAHGRYATVIVVSEVFGIHEWVRDICRRLAKLGYAAIAPNFFFRADPNSTLPSIPMSDFDSIMKIVKTASMEQVQGDVGSALAWARTRPFVDASRFAITGFCWGGQVVWLSCEHFPELKAGAAWYGQLKTATAHAADLKAPVIGFYGGLDKGITPADIDAMNAALKAVGKTESGINVYPDAQHGFLADYRSSYNEADGKDAWAKMLEFFKANGVKPGRA